MKDAIIQYSIAELKKEGLRFSIDKVAKKLKISKKTIYKYFSAKEELAVAIYQTFYENAINQLILIETDHSENHNAVQLLTLYFQSHCMVRKEIFNKYSLNESIRILAQENHNHIKAYIENKLPPDHRAADMIIIDGSLQKLCDMKEYQETVINKLGVLLC